MGCSSLFVMYSNQKQLRNMSQFAFEMRRGSVFINRSSSVVSFAERASETFLKIG